MRRFRRFWPVVFCFLALVAAGAQNTAPPRSPRVVVEPDVLASRDGNSPHVEVHAAANPRRARNLIVGSITHTRPDGSPATKVYATFDGGRSWSDAAFPEQMAEGGGDPQVAFTPRGTALFATLNTAPDETGRTRAFLHVYRSEDGGRTWSKPADLGASYDHEMIAVDHTTGRFGGRIYLSALYGREYDLGLFRSDDDGRSFIGPVRFFRAGGREKGANVLPMGVFRDGTLLATFHDFPLGAERSAPGPRRSAFFTVLSDDGGVTFSAPRPAPDEVFPAYTDPNVRLAGDAAIAIDHSSRYPDRVYRVWNDARFAGGRYRIVLSTSTDRGTTWSEPRLIDATSPAASDQFMPVVAVNRDGVLGVRWQDSRDAGAEPGYDLYFSASLDGGATFLAPQRVSTETSRPIRSGNLTVTPITFRSPQDSGAVRMAFLSAAGRWGNGGDYGGMVVDADGAFHPVWADARTGTFQVWTARVVVADGAAAGNSTGEPPAREVDITTSIEFVPDPSRFDQATGELELRLRLRNVGRDTIRGPVTLTIRKFGSGMGSEEREFSPTVLNAANRRPGDGGDVPVRCGVRHRARAAPRGCLRAGAAALQGQGRAAPARHAPGGHGNAVAPIGVLGVVGVHLALCF
ncbi:MAG: sialidase family protein [Gemmatimonadaceae bacterium]